MSTMPRRGSARPRTHAATAFSKWARDAMTAQRQPVTDATILALWKTLEPCNDNPAGVTEALRVPAPCAI